MKPFTVRAQCTRACHRPSQPRGTSTTRHASKIGSTRSVEAPRSLRERETAAILLQKVWLSQSAQPLRFEDPPGPHHHHHHHHHLSAPPGTALAPPATGSQDSFDEQLTERDEQADGTPVREGVHLPPAMQALLNRIPARVRGLVCCNLLVLLVATNWVVVKQAGDSFDPFLFAAMRFGVAAAALLPFLAKAVKCLTTLRAGIELGCLTAVGYLAQSEGLLTTDASRASFLSTFTVIVVPLLAGASGKGVRPLTWAACAAALAGVALLEHSGAPPCIGDAWSGISAVAFGFQIFRTEHWTRLLGAGQGIPLISVVLATTATLAAVAAGYMHADELTQYAAHFSAANSMSIDFGGVLAGASRLPWVQVAYTGFLTTDVALLMEMVALRDVSSTEAAVIYTLEPVLGAAFAFAAFGERWTASGWLGAALIVSSCLGMQLFGSEEEENAALKSAD